MKNNYDCEVLIIGSGAGGSTIAETLSNQGMDVLMVEEGPNTNIENKIEKVSELQKKVERFADILDSINSLEDKKKHLWKEIYEKNVFYFSSY